MLLSTQPLGQE